MLNRRHFGAMGLSAMALAAMEGRAFAQPKEGKDHMEHNAEFQKCAEACSDCQRECESCSTHCAHMLADGKKEHARTLATCRDCADICGVAAEISSRGGPFAGLVCEACAEACARCAKECEKFPDDKHMKKCAEECRKCEKECREMVQHAGHGK